MWKFLKSIGIFLLVVFFIVFIFSLIEYFTYNFMEGIVKEEVIDNQKNIIGNLYLMLGILFTSSYVVEKFEVNKLSNKYKITFTIIKYAYIILMILVTFILVNFFGEYLESISDGYFNFDIYSSYVPMVITIVAIYMGYRQHEDNKVRNNTEELYKQSLNKLEKEEELFYEYFNELTKLYSVEKYEKPLDAIKALSEINMGIYKKHDKLSILTNIFACQLEEECMQCDFHKKYFIDVIKTKKQLSDISLTIFEEINKELTELTDIYREVINGNVLEDYFWKKYNEIRNNLSDLVSEKGKTELSTVYSIYKHIARQFINEDRKNNFKQHENCKKCKHNYITYENLEKQKEISKQRYEAHRLKQIIDR